MLYHTVSRNFFCCIGHVWSCGDGDYGKLGRGGSDSCKVPQLVERLKGQHVVQVYCGTQFSAALAVDGKLFTWCVGVRVCVCVFYYVSC